MFTRACRAGAALLGTALAASVLAVSAPTTALADTTYCDNQPALGNYHIIDPSTGWLDIFWINSVVQTFDTADSRVVTNNLPYSISGTAASQVSSTFTLAATASVSVTALDKALTATVSSSITTSTTTQIGISTTFNVPAYGAVRADYGTLAYNINYHYDLFELSQGHCWWKGSNYSVSVNAPTLSQGWNLTLLPTINPAGVVNGSDYSAGDIHSNTTVAIFGQGFVPGDQVLVYDATAGYQYPPITAGSLWWYDSSGQINFTLPNVPTSHQALVSVVTATGLQSNSDLITINP